MVRIRTRAGKKEQGRPKEFTILRANSRSRLSFAYDSREIGPKPRLARSLVVLAAPSLPGRLSLNYERGTRFNSIERTKGRFKLNARLFHLHLVLLPERHVAATPVASSIPWSSSFPQLFLVQLFIPLLFSISLRRCFQKRPLFSWPFSAILSRLVNHPAVFLTSYVRG